MAFAPSTVTGSAVTGLTTPTYTFAADVAPVANGKQFALTALGGTQTGVRLHSPTSPFSATWYRDAMPKQIGPVVNGILNNVPNNKYRLIMRVGYLPLAGQQYRTGVIRVEFDIPAGTEVADAAQLKATFSCLGGLLNQHANDHFNSVSTGIS
jgi:hypothetical protein